MKRIKMKLFSLSMILFFMGCGKSFLEVKSDVSLAIPKKIADYQALLDNSTSLMNQGSSHRLGVIGSDELDLKHPDWQSSISIMYRNAYIWSEDVYQGEQVPDWNDGYERILISNLVLDGLKSIDRNTDPVAWDHARGGALFFRAFNYYQLAQLFCLPFDSKTAERDLGIPLRLEADITLTSHRATVEEVYNQIINDLDEALSLLPSNVSVKVRPTKLAALALKSKVYLMMGMYEDALLSSDMALDEYDLLLDYNDIIVSGQYSFANDRGQSNPEVIFHCYFGAIPLLTQATMNVSGDLLSLYEQTDLRRFIFFNTRPNGSIAFRGSFTGSVAYFTGLTTSELLLIRAECLTRMDRLQEALEALNRLLRHRYTKGQFIPLESTEKNEILDWIVKERRKELVFRGVRWEDLRRLNKDAKLATAIQRSLGDKVYVLEPNSLRYVWPIPSIVVDLTNMPQNER